MSTRKYASGEDSEAYFLVDNLYCTFFLHISLAFLPVLPKMKTDAMKPEPLTRTSVTLPESMLQEFQLVANDRGARSISAAVRYLIKREIDQWKADKKRKELAESLPKLAALGAFSPTADARIGHDPTDRYRDEEQPGRAKDRIIEPEPGDNPRSLRTDAEMSAEVAEARKEGMESRIKNEIKNELKAELVSLFREMREELVPR